MAKLKYFCQMCNKQCKDKNGFTCHSDSESHRQQMLLFLANPEKYISQFSSEFLAQFSALIDTEWTSVSEVYNRLIRDADHVHLNATRWGSLEDFLGANKDTIDCMRDPNGRELCRKVSLRPVKVKKARIERIADPVFQMPRTQIFVSPATVRAEGSAKMSFGLSKKMTKRIVNETSSEDDS